MWYDKCTVDLSILFKAFHDKNLQENLIAMKKKINH